MWTIPVFSTSTKTEQGGSGLVSCGAGLQDFQVRSKIEGATTPEGKNHAQEEDSTKRPVSVREWKEVQELLLREGIPLTFRRWRRGYPANFRGRLTRGLGARSLGLGDLAPGRLLPHRAG
jgi:hypothetical protein